MAEIKKLPKSQVEITLTIPSAQIASEYEKVYQSLAKDVTIPGFRPGKAPRNLIESKLGHAKIYEEAINNALFETYRQVITELKINPISYPQFKIEKAEEGKDLEVKTTVTVRPTPKIGDYKKIKVQKGEIKHATPEEIKELIEASFESWKEKQKEAKKKKSEPKIETATSLSEAVKKGEDKVEVADLSELTFEDFLKDNLVKTRDELEKKVTETLSEQKKNKAEQEFEQKILEKVMELTEVELPETMVEEELHGMIDSLENQFKPFGLKLDDYLAQKKQNRNDLEKEWRPQAEKNVKLEFGLSAVAEAENILITDAEVEEVIKAVEDPKVKAELEKPHQKVYIKYSLQREKTIQKLRELAEEK